jgi:hypothetical protein
MIRPSLDMLSKAFSRLIRNKTVAKPVYQPSQYFSAYLAWKSAQKCLGCGVQHSDDCQKTWMTEYLCEPCWLSGVRGEPETMFDGHSGNTYPTGQITAKTG